MAAADTAPALAPAPVAAPALPRLGGARARARKPPRLAPEAIEFQDELDRLIEEPPPPSLRFWPWVLATLLAALVTLASVAQVDVVVTGSGRLAADAPPLVVQPMERAVIQEIRVRPGQVVVQGQILALMDPTFAEADRLSLVAQRRSLSAQLERIESELAGVPAPMPLTADGTLQSLLLAQRASLYAARMAGYAADIRALESSIAALRDGDSIRAEQTAIAAEVESMRGRLLASQVGSRLNALAARSERLRAEQDQRQARHRAEELTGVLAAKQAERDAFRDDWRRQLLEEVVRLRGELQRTEDQLSKAERLAAMSVLVAPADGVVLDIARRSAGSVLREAEALVTLVPLNAPLVAEITLRSSDIGRLRGEDPAVVKVDAFPFQRHGALQGRLQSLAPDSQPREGEAPGPPVHRARITFDTPSLPDAPPGSRLIPGMTVTAEIQVGARRIITFFIEPLLRGLQESIREP
ncbi:HlyD family type I secretion periplasmic adaptor subunit [Roseomonas stagni]|uniref:Membrane fusion protein (MFP) family protein n=1 Tax=Falsiroseomonas algicola TaxID=2716930 RepID=A0A6M1LTL0_9PROT|nr:HlyD family type I secretion periplasmic adaptor subunit [Falsiroseomonas algicola]NGM23815.1 HlyD family type I secretion periplasmic adaptor subunit [Falsiroseomonas algicola]